MSLLRPQFYVSSSIRAVDKGGSVPPWYGNVNNKSNWYAGTPEFDYYFYNVVDNGSTDNYVNYTVYIQYGHNSTGWATAKFFVYSVYGSVSYIGTQRDKLFNANVTLNSFWSRQTNYAAGGVSVVWDVTIFGQSVSGFTGTTTTEFTYNPNTNRQSNITVPYNGYITQTCLGVSVRYPNGEYPNSNIQLGVALYNDIEPYYYPFATRPYANNGRLVSLNDLPERTIAVRRNGTLVKLSKLRYDQQNTPNNGHTRYRPSVNNTTLHQVPIVWTRG